MRDSDKKAFAGLMAGVATNYGRDITPELLDVFWAALADHGMEAVTRAINAHVRVSRFMPTVADVLERLAFGAGQARPGADEAWLRTPPEEDSYWATDEMLGAWAVVAQEMHSERPDRTGARMAFRDAYTRLVAEAQALGRPVQWRLVRGTRRDNLVDTIHEGVRLGYVPAAEAESWLRIEGTPTLGLQPLLEGAARHEQTTALQALASLRGLLSPPAPGYDLAAVREECEQRDRELESFERREVAHG